MPAYFFHLGFELYPSRSSPQTTYTPPPSADIFSELPAHSSSSWAALAPPQRSYSSVLKPCASSSEALRPPNPRRYSHRTRASFSEHRDSPVPLVKPPTRPAHRRTRSFAHKDWRFDAISILSIDMKPAEGGDDATRPRAKSLKLPAGNSGGLATKGKFIPSNPKDTELGWGVVHLYRDGQETPGLYDDDGAGAAFNEADCTTLCILAVPSYMTPSDLLGFVGEHTREHVSHFRLIRTARANKYMVLMKFWEAKKAREWRKEWNGKPFNSMEPEYCHVVFIKSITFQSDASNRDPSSYPDLTNDPFTPAPTTQATASSVSSPVEPSSITPSLTAKPIAPPTASLVELPTCPVCLERMDETTGLLTILCQHVFHCACLEKWRGSGCPVCRYTQNDAFSHNRATDGDAPDNECSVCGSTQNLWICLICGNIGCGRYDSAHAFAHYEATNHTYAMDVVSQHVWDYAGDGYVHRLIQNKADGKLVDLPASAHAGGLKNAGMTGYANDTVPREKLDNMGVEYAYLLTSQLESQRAYFEEQVERAADKAAKASSVADEASRTVAALSADFAKLQSQHADAVATIAALEKDAARNAQKAASASDLARKLTKQFREEQTINESLMARIKHLEKKAEDAETKVKEVEAQKAELEEQNRDLSFFISGQEKLREMQGDEANGLGESELQSGYVEVGQKEEKGRRKGKGRKK
ncbi:zf-UBP-domain-containing protein [Bimuria novae-zelandiae CBS 107.79]|uniref:Zf-UBP-domain-containing protein n=1 Tax=Bimuria novae-zelandiae CBS 107.79 TaxID=1447943 RepID=A0A6A5VP83_9PLEO|nr:zf-UBP-domain-containing protein [Bimuria novae-zelandiae CBS 107.79]